MVSVGLDTGAQSRTRRLTQLLTALAVKMKDLSSAPGPNKVEGEN